MLTEINFKRIGVIEKEIFDKMLKKKELSTTFAYYTI